MSGQDEGWHYTNNPISIWALPQEIRLKAVTDMFRRQAIDYAEAHIRDAPQRAQEAATGAIMVIAGLFPDRDDPAHLLIQSLVGAIVTARSGSKNHILLKAGARIDGTKGGYANAIIAAFGVACVGVLTDRGLSQFRARSAVAKILSDLGVSRRRGEHGEPKPITEGAVRKWEENVEDNPIPAAVAPAMRQTIEGNIRKRGLSDVEEVMDFLPEQAADFLPSALAL